MEEEKLCLQESIDETVDEMKRKISELTDEGLSIDDGFEKKAQYEELRTQVSDMLKQTVKNIEQMRSDFGDNEKVKETADMIKLKSNEAFDTFSKVIKEVQAENKFKEKMEDLAEETDKFVSKVVANPKVKSMLESEKVKSVLDKVNESRPEFDEKMDKAKDLTIDAAEKGLSSLKKWLKPKEDKIIDEQINLDDENEIDDEYRGDE
jgi:hypothetical protein